MGLIHLVFFGGIVALTLGISSITIVSLLYGRYRNKLLLGYLILLSAVTVLFFTELVDFFYDLLRNEPGGELLPIYEVTSTIYYVLCGLIVYMFPLLITRLIGKRFYRLRILFFILALFYPLGLVIYHCLNLDLSVLADTFFS